MQQSQEIIYDFLLKAVKSWPAEDVLSEFRQLFVHQVNSVDSDVSPALYEVILSNQEEEFKNTLKRSCYILINNWETARNYKAIHELVEVFSDPALERKTVSPTLKRLRTWILNFVNSQDFQELKLFADRYENPNGARVLHWKQRYTHFLLAPQYIDLDNPIEQREAARTLSRKLKERFKFDLAMYIARSQSTLPQVQAQQKAKNPTVLGDQVLQLTKRIVAKRGAFGYTNLASIFLKQIEGLSYQNFKFSLLRYLVFNLENQDFVKSLTVQLDLKLKDLYLTREDEVITDALKLRTCNRLIDWLTTENHSEPSPLFISAVSHGLPLPLVIVLLKIIMISRYSRPHLESRIAELIRYYENLSEQDCPWIINFLEILNITFAVHADNVEYSLVRPDPPSESPSLQIPPVKDMMQIQDLMDIDRCRLFSHQKGMRLLPADPEAFTLGDSNSSLPGEELSSLTSQGNL